MRTLSRQTLRTALRAVAPSTALLTLRATSGAQLQVAVGAGRGGLLGLRLQHRGQPLATFRLLFNALLSGP